MRWAVLVLLLAAPLASSQSGVTLSDVRLPDLAVADYAFEARVRVTNDATPRTVYLFAALYQPVDSQVCGPSTDPRFRAFTPLVQARIPLKASESVDYPSAGDVWLQKFAPNKVPEGRSSMEWCVFAAEDSTANAAQIRYLAFQSVPLATRSKNTAPVALFTWSPAVPEATRNVRFTAEGADQDGDQVSYRWDFGHANASGRAVAEGPEASTFFFPAGTYPVTLRVSDGFAETVITQQITIAEEGEGPSDPTPSSPSAKTPLSTGLVAAALVMAALVSRRRFA